MHAARLGKLLEQVAHKPGKIGTTALVADLDKTFPCFGAIATKTLQVPQRRYS